jgi:hypothetical protein
MKIFLPYRGEFGHRVMWHAPQVYACREPDKVVICEKGQEIFYPGAGEYCHCDRLRDDKRRMRLEREHLDTWRAIARISWPDGECIEPDPNPDAPRKYFTPQPIDPDPVWAESKWDVIVCPRMRDYGSDKNWWGWQYVVRKLQQSGLEVAAVGNEQSMWVPCLSTYEGSPSQYKINDNTVAGMLNAKMVLATDSGTAHLAVMCGRPLLIVTHNHGCIAEGVDDVGRPYWPVMMDRYVKANHCGVLIDRIFHGWNDPDLVIETTRKFLKDQKNGG